MVKRPRFSTKTGVTVIRGDEDVEELGKDVGNNGVPVQKEEVEEEGAGGDDDDDENNSARGVVGLSIDVIIIDEGVDEQTLVTVRVREGDEETEEEPD